MRNLCIEMPYLIPFSEFSFSEFPENENLWLYLCGTADLLMKEFLSQIGLYHYWFPKGDSLRFIHMVCVISLNLTACAEVTLTGGPTLQSTDGLPQL